MAYRLPDPIDKLKRSNRAFLTALARYHRNHGGKEHRRLAITIDGIVADQVRREAADA